MIRCQPLQFRIKLKTAFMLIPHRGLCAALHRETDLIHWLTKELYTGSVFTVKLVVAVLLQTQLRVVFGGGETKPLIGQFTVGVG